MMRRRLFGLVMLGLAAAPIGAGAQSTAAEPIGELHQGLLVIMRAGSATPFPRRYESLAPVIDQVFDLASILRACVGPRWMSLAAHDRAGLLTVFRRFTVASYVANFDSFSGERFEFLAPARSAGRDEIVSTRIVAPNPADTVRIDYLMRQEGPGWRVVDVLLDGTISRVAVQRSDFRSLLGDSGNVAGLIASLQQKVADLSRGTLTAG